ncbi:MAG: nucleoside diphosphate kinase regulator [Anaerolineales bacterium]|nr:nucleoside diphosphate kinase regulator [Anaerolineae bacterium]PWB70967.1 MAG: nucleoside diphosphate kinase regulator [Anaerolineales bacterium]
MSEKTIHITELDRQRLIDLIMDAQSGEYRGSVYLEKLRGELDRAQIVLPQEIPTDVITMNTKVALLDLDTQEEEIYTLVYPENANSTEGKVSILAPIGTAMLGYRVNDVFEWEVPAGKRRLKVDKILYQPEASGDYEL